MTNREWLNSLSNEELTDEVSRKMCFWCVNFDKDDDKCLLSIINRPPSCCRKGIIEWLNKKHIEPMPEIKIGDAIYSYIDESRAMFIVMSNIHACNSHGVIVRWRELDDIWKIERMNDEKEMLEVIWRADDE